MAIADEFQDILSLHQVYLEFYSNGFIKKLQNEVKNLERDIRSDFSVYQDVLADPKVKTKLKQNIRQSLEKFETFTTEAVQEEMKNFTSSENEFYSDQFKNLIGDADLEVNTEDNEKVYNSVQREKINFANGEVYTFLAFLLKFFRDNRKRIEQQLDSSIMLDQDPEMMRQQIVGTNGQTHISAVRVAAVAATLITFISSKVRERNLKINEDKLKGYQWASVIDSITSSFCRWADGRTWFYDTEEGTLGSPYTPPAHNRCRSTTTPILKSWDELGLDSSYSNVFNGEPPQRTTYYEWLERQPTSIQKEVMGTVRYDMWKKEGISPDRFYNRTGKYLTLDQLKQKNIDIPKEYLKYVRGG